MLSIDEVFSSMTKLERSFYNRKLFFNVLSFSTGSYTIFLIDPNTKPVVMWFAYIATTLWFCFVWAISLWYPNVNKKTAYASAVLAFYFAIGNLALLIGYFILRVIINS